MPKQRYASLEPCALPLYPHPLPFRTVQGSMQSISHILPELSVWVLPVIPNKSHCLSDSVTCNWKWNQDTSFTFYYLLLSDSEACSKITEGNSIFSVAAVSVSMRMEFALRGWFFFFSYVSVLTMSYMHPFTLIALATTLSYLFVPMNKKVFFWPVRFPDPNF